MKKYLLSLLLVCVGFISFCSADVINNSNCSTSAGVVCSNDSFSFIRFGSNSSNLSSGSSINVSANYALKSSYPQYFRCYDTSDNLLYDGTSIGNNWQPLLFFKVNGYCVYFGSFSSSVNLYDFTSLFSSSSCDPQYTSEECQSVYSLVPSIDLTSCQGDLSSCNSSLSGCQSNLSGCMTNLDNYSTSLNTCSTNLNVCNTSLSSCMSSNCPSNSGNVSWSSLFVNGIQHLGAPTIRVNIPEEISWDYLSTTEDFVLDVEGYNQDTEYIESVLEVQNYTPTREDFNNTFMLFKSFSGLLVATLFVILVFYLLKKLFK